MATDELEVYDYFTTCIYTLAKKNYEIYEIYILVVVACEGNAWANLN